MAQRILFFTLILGLAACSSLGTVKVRDGKTAYETKQYAVAVKLLRSEYSKADTRLERGKISYMLGESYKALQQGDDAIEWYQKAYDNSYGVDALKEVAYLFKQTEQYNDAIRTFKDLSFEIGSPYEYRKDIQACELAQKWLEDKRQPFRVSLSDFNSAKADYAPVLFGQEKLVFTSDRAGGKGDAVYNWTGNYFSDLYEVDLATQNVMPFQGGLNTEFNEGTASFSADQKTVFFTRCYGDKKTDQYCKIMRADWDGQNWSPPQPLEFLKPETNYMHPVLSKDGNSLYFSTDDGEGFGGYDIYVSDKTAGGDWGLPRPLSAAINTSGNEQFPSFQGDTLYFSSNRHTSMGGLDIFKTYKMNNGAWAPVYNLKSPINSGADDFGLVILPAINLPDGVLQKGYLTSARMNGLGGDDIYSFEKIVLPPEPEPPVVVEDPVDPKLLLEIYVLEKIYEVPNDPNSNVLGRRPIVEAGLDISFAEEQMTVTTDEEGRYLLELTPDRVYDFLASKEGFLRNVADFSSEGLKLDPNNPEQIYELEIELEKIFINQEIVLENIYYDFEEAFIRDDAKPTLDDLATQLSLNPEITIELSSHTDCRGRSAYNMDLSQRRAQSAVDYLITKGIDRTRLEARGYGKTVPANDCICARCTEDEHQENRRTAFKITQESSARGE